MKIAVKEAGKPLQIIETDIKYRSDCVKQFIGTEELLEFVRLNDKGTLCMGVNQDGLLLGLPPNFLFEANNHFYPIQLTVGTVVFTRHKYVNVYNEFIPDFEVDDIQPEDLEIILKMLDSNYQQKLYNIFIQNTKK